ncbi:hypothetical protein F4802DRAFT_416924 [Xylaria palmicola]|nr:hypothetical protein F4802DRAFT_416924 [Xylaria palmicola]
MSRKAVPFRLSFRTVLLITARGDDIIVCSTRAQISSHIRHELSRSSLSTLELRGVTIPLSGAGAKSKCPGIIRISIYTFYIVTCLSPSNLAPGLAASPYYLLSSAPVHLHGWYTFLPMILLCDKTSTLAINPGIPSGVHASMERAGISLAATGNRALRLCRRRGKLFLGPTWMGRTGRHTASLAATCGQAPPFGAVYGVLHTTSRIVYSRSRTGGPFMSGWPLCPLNDM